LHGKGAQIVYLAHHALRVGHHGCLHKYWQPFVGWSPTAGKTKKNPATKGGVEVNAEGFLLVVISST
jgi:hypothetical protein